MKYKILIILLLFFVVSLFSAEEKKYLCPPAPKFHKRTLPISIAPTPEIIVVAISIKDGPKQIISDKKP